MFNQQQQMNVGSSSASSPYSPPPAGAVATSSSGNDDKKGGLGALFPAPLPAGNTIPAYTSVASPAPPQRFASENKANLNYMNNNNNNPGLSVPAPQYATVAPPNMMGHRASSQQLSVPSTNHASGGGSEPASTQSFLSSNTPGGQTPIMMNQSFQVPPGATPVAVYGAQLSPNVAQGYYTAPSTVGDEYSYPDGSQPPIVGYKNEDAAKKEKNKKTMMIVIIVILVLILVGAGVGLGVYFGTKSSNNSNTTNASTNSQGGATGNPTSTITTTIPGLGTTTFTTSSPTSTAITFVNGYPAGSFQLQLQKTDQCLSAISPPTLATCESKPSNSSTQVLYAVTSTSLGLAMTNWKSLANGLCMSMYPDTTAMTSTFNYLLNFLDCGSLQVQTLGGISYSASSGIVSGTLSSGSFCLDSNLNIMGCSSSQNKWTQIKLN